MSNVLKDSRIIQENGILFIQRSLLAMVDVVYVMSIPDGEQTISSLSN